MSIVENHLKHSIIVAFLLILSASINASPWQESIQADICQQWHAIAAAEAECELSFIGVSNQYALPNCNNDWQYSLTRTLQAGRNGIEVSCDSPRWKQNLAVQLHIYKEIAVLAKSANAGHKVNAADITFIRHDIGASSKDFYTKPSQVIGQQLKRSFRVGTLLTTDMLDAPLLIKRNDMVSIELIRPGIKIESKGVALENGQQGQRIRVRNIRSQRTITATVKEAGVVEIN